MKKIQLTQGKVALVDDEDYDHLMVRSWCHSGGYAWAKIDGKKQSMHRYLLKTPHGMDTDHINYNGCDNQRHNLRIATRGQNTIHTRYVRIGATSRFIGVSWCNERKYWRAFITINNHSTSLGRFDKEEDAAIAYNIAARKHFGSFANINSV